MNTVESGQIELRATTHIRNNAMLSARERLGISQRDAAKLCGVPCSAYFSLEKLEYPASYNDDYVTKIAIGLCIVPDSVFPPSLAGVHIKNKSVKTRVIECSKMLEYRESQNRLRLVSPDIIAEERDQIELIKKYMEKLSFREKGVISVRYGTDGGPCCTLDETAKIYKVSRNRIRQIEAVAIRKIQNEHKKVREVDFVEPMNQDVIHEHYARKRNR